ncbi:MAG TPA: ferritin-like domain-containing protein [Chthoniobacterales bacterium]
MKINSLRDVYIHELKDLFSAETQLMRALPEMVKAAADEELSAGFEQHLHRTEEHVNRLEKILEGLGETTSGDKCQAMEGILEEGADIIHEDGIREVKDALLISSAQRAEHYEIAGYGSARTFAELLGEREAAKILQQTLNEVFEADQQLTKIAGTAVNRHAQEMAMP